jgi:transcription elongation factor GreB
MTNAFTTEPEDDDQPDEEAAAVPAAKNYITPAGLQRLRAELRFLLTRERPAVTSIATTSAGCHHSRAR